MTKILVVEDNELNRELMEELLEAHGFEIITAKNGSEGIGKAKELLPPLILMDIQMPDMDGTEACNHIKNAPETSHINIVAVTSYAMKGAKEKYISLGFDDYMSKPIDTKALVKLAKDMTNT